MKSKMLGALALLTLIGALFVMQSADQYTPTADAATGSIDALNMGTCLTTDATVFKGDCDMLSNDAAGTENDWEVRAKIAEVKTLYATYAHDPKTARNEPRAILADSDLLKISISDPGRDRRTGVLIRGASKMGAIGDDDTTDTLGNVIRADLDNDKLHYSAPNDDIAFSSEDGDGDGIEIHIRNTPTSSIVTGSGNLILNFSRAGSPSSGSDWQFEPGDFDVDAGAVVRFYGCIEMDTGSTSNGDCDQSGEDIVNLEDSLSVDEDASNGEASGDIAPWLGVNVSVPSDKQVVILAVYYRTSDEENLVGGQKYYHCPTAPNTSLYQDDNNDWRCDNPTTTATKENNEAETRGVDRVNYTSDEKSDNDALLVQVKSDGDVTSQSLWLKETGRFEGRYEGFVRLTDANGDGSVDDNPDTTNVNEARDRDDWGLVTDDASGADETGAAVLGVESGPVTVEYRDSDGKKQTLRIEIDNTPPTITVSNPANGGSSGDQSPDFSGTIEDADSGLVDKSFRLVVDNEVDGEGKNDDYVVNMPSASGVTSGSLAKVTHVGEYSGYSDAASTFGEVAASELYDLGDDSCDNSPDCYIESEEYDDGASRGTFDDNIRLDLQDGTKGDIDTRDREFEIDFQAFVLDMAGNVGFSDSDAANPRFINDLGTESAKRDTKIDDQVLGYYSAHIIILDEKDPDLIEEQTATGYYGLDSDGKPTIHDRSAIMVVFDGPIAASSVSNSTFSVELDDESSASVIDHEVSKNYVFLKLASELASDATPKIDIAQGEKVEDMAGNETFGREQDEFEAQDGISPKLTVTLSGGSGSGTGDEGPEKLTKDKITVHVSSDEALQDAPLITVVCSSLRWNEDADEMEEENEVDSRHDIDDYIANRNGSFTSEPSENPVTTKPRIVSNPKTDADDMYRYTCGYDSDDDNFGDDFVPTRARALARPGENWEHTWQNQTGADRALENGVLTAVAFARDRSRYEGPSGNLRNWGSASTEFTLDTVVKYPDPDRGDFGGGGDLQPAPDGQSKEARPFVLIEFNETTTVTLDSVELDDVEIADQFEQPDHNRFLYWPLSLSQGEHEVEVEATDAAGNGVSFSYDFEVVARGDFVIGLNAGWNAISVPADPIDTAIGSVFTDPAITTVIGWDTQGWRIAMRRDGVWESNDKYGALNEIRARYGYWVKSEGFVRQPVALKGGTSRDAGGTPILISIPTEPGWNFVGVVDQDGDQTENDFSESLKGSDLQFITAGEYLGSNYVRAYTWDATFSRFDVVRPDHGMTIGDGVWVYYPETGGIAP